MRKSLPSSTGAAQLKARVTSQFRRGCRRRAVALVGAKHRGTWMTAAHLALDLDNFLSAVLDVQLQTILINTCAFWISFHSVRSRRSFDDTKVRVGSEW